ncbi:unnamed protein product [Closterium sp. Naga37s-1]|nr:unnamed protein product [Closterium sp. Naga37s-1]
MMFSLDNIPEASRWLEGGVEMVALFPPLPAALTPEQKTELMHEMLRLVLGPLMMASSVERGLGREEGGRTYETAMRTAVKHNTRVLTRRSRRMAVGDAQDPVWAEYCAALGTVVMDGVARVMQRMGIAASGVQVHTALAIPPHDRLLGRGPGHMVKAAPGEGKFSYVAIDGGEGEWYARCLMLFHFMDDEAALHRRAVVRYFDEHPTPCPVTGCVRLLPTEGEDEYAVVEVESILSLAHIVPCFTEPRFSLVNRFLFDE